MPARLFFGVELSRPRPLLGHVGLCLAFLTLPYVFAPDGLTRLTAPGAHPHEKVLLLSYLLMLGFFYLNYYVLIPRLYFQKQYALFLLSLTLGFGVVASLVTLADQHTVLSPWFGPPHSNPLPPGNLPRGGEGRPPRGGDLNHLLFMFLVGVFGSLTVRTRNRWQEAERARLHTELAYLKAQINPHFLFNTLNSIYALALEQSERTAEAVVKLSVLMRYVIREADRPLVPVAHELDYLRHYVGLQQLRLDAATQVAFTVEGTPTGLTIAPLLLVSFIENAFKYGVNPQESSRIEIRIAVVGAELRLHVVNRKVRLLHDAETAGGIGLRNTRARLQLLYPGRHQLTIHDDEHSFAVDLHLTLA